MNTPKFKIAAPYIGVDAVQTDDQLLAAIKEYDYVVVPKLNGKRLSKYGRVLDEALLGLITRTCELVGPAGSRREIDLADHNFKFGKLKHILVVGLGDYHEYTGKVACALTNVILTQATIAEAERVGILVAPKRLTEDTVTLKGVAAITRCRVAVFAAACKHPMPSELNFICSPQAKSHLEFGLEVHPPRCVVCTLPEL